MWIVVVVIDSFSHFSIGPTFIAFYHIRQHEGTMLYTEKKNINQFYLEMCQIDGRSKYLDFYCSDTTLYVFLEEWPRHNY